MTGLDSIECELSASPSTLYLLILTPDGTWRSQLLPPHGILVIGRDAEVDIRVDEPEVSRRHARLEVTGAGDLRVVDLDSANGTLVGGKLVRNDAAVVRPGEPLRIGRTVLTAHTTSPLVGAPLPPLQGLAMADVYALIAKAAPKPINVLLLGETGVGKVFIAERIHEQSTRAQVPLMQLNCAMLPAALLESELFGYEKGAFTDAKRTKPGLLEKAAGGTVFLDEVGEMPLEVQAKLLLAIET